MSTETIDLSAITRNIIVEQGTSITINFAITTSNDQALDMTGYDLRLQVRREPNSSEVLINCTLANSKLAWISQSGGTFKLVLTASDTSSIRFQKDETVIEGVYDLEIIDSSSNVSKPCKGAFIISREVTR